MALPRQSFNAGEVSPKLWWRSDLRRYSSSCRYLENFLVTPQGAAWRAPGTEQIARIGDVDLTQARVIAFDVNQNLSYLVVFVPNAPASKLRIYSTDGGLLAELDSPWSADEFNQVYVDQSYDVLFMAHPGYPTLRLERRSNTDWTLTEHIFSGGPIGTPNAEEEAIVKMNSKIWNNTSVYALNDYVQKGAAYTATGNSANYFTHREKRGGKSFVYVDYFWTRIELGSGEVASGGFAISDRIVIDDTDLAGDWEVQQIDAANDYLYLACGTYQENGGTVENDFGGIAMGAATIYLAGNKPQLYVAVTAVPAAQDPATSPTYWKPVDTLHGIINLSSNQGGMFTASDVGRLLRMQYKNDVSDSGEWGITAAGSVTKTLPAYGTVTLKTEGGVWEGKIVLQQSFDGGGSWEDIGLIESVNGASNASITREIAEFGVVVRAVLTERSDSAAGTGPTDTGCNYYLDVTGIQYAYLNIISVTDDANALADLLNYVPDYVITWKWAWSAFGGDNGYPGVVTIYDERMIVTGVPGSPGTIYGSQVNNWEDWQSGTLETSPITFSLPVSRRNNIRWAVARQELVLGSDSGEYTLGSRNNDEVMSGFNVRSKQHTQYGSDQIQALATADLILYVENGGRRLRSAQYSFNEDGYIAVDVSILADHLTEDNQIVGLAYSRSPLPVVWCWRDDGTMLCFVYERVNEVNGWSRRTFSDGGSHLSAAVTQATGGDILWSLASRPGGVYLEKMDRTNKCLDWTEHIAAADIACLYPLLGSESTLQVFDNDWAEVEDPYLGTGIILDQLTAITDLVIKYDGDELVEEVDWIELSVGGLVWIKDKTDKSKVTVFDFVTEKTEDVDWSQELATDSVALTLLDDGIDMSLLVFDIDSVTATVNVDYFLQANRVVLFPGAKGSLIEGTYQSNALVSGVDYIQQDILYLFNPYGIEDTENVRIGIQENSLLAPTDLTALADMGGPGGTTRIHEAEVYVVNSLGGEVSGNDGKTWQPIRDLTPTVVVGEELPTYTGKKDVRFSHGTQKDGALIRIRNTSPHQMTVACVAIDVRRSE